MTLEIFMEKERVTMKLLKNGRTIDSETFLYYHDLSDVLITNLDKLLQRNSIDTSVLKLFKLQENIGENSTSYKIAAAFLEGLKVKI